jgi:protein ImuA
VCESVDILATVKRRIAALETPRSAGAGGRVASGHAALDAALGGGFARGRVHELFGAAVEDAGAIGAFGLLLGRLAADAGEGDGEGPAVRPLLWLRTAGAARMGGVPYGPGLSELGIDPADLLLGTMADEAMLLKAAVDALRCPELGALVVEYWGAPRLLDLTVSRRLVLAAEASGVTALLLMNGAEPAPSAAETRWRVAAAPSVPLPGNAPGMSAFDLTLLRRRAGPDGMAWRIAWDKARGRFVDWNGLDSPGAHGEAGSVSLQDGRDAGGTGEGRGAALSGAVVPLPAVRPAADRAA